MRQKSLLPLAQAINDSRCPFVKERQAYNALAAAKPTIDSRGNEIDPGDPELLSCFIRLNGKDRGPLFLDLDRMGQLANARRLGQAEAPNG